MRIRKLFGKTTRSRRVPAPYIPPFPRHASYEGSQLGDTAPTRWPVRRPHGTSKPHPQSHLLETGSCKYTTGPLKVSPGIRKSAGISALAWKVYTAKPALHDYRPPLTAACVASSRLLGAGTLSSVLQFACRATLQAFEGFDSTRNVFLQLTRPSGISQASFATPTKRHPQTHWTSCVELHRETPEEATSRPYFVFTISDLSSRSYFPPFLSKSSASRPDCLTIRVSGHLKPAIYSAAITTIVGHTEGIVSIASSPLQVLADHITRDVAAGTAGGRAGSATQALSTIEDLTVRSLKTSALAPLLDFSALQLSLISHKVQRVVHNRILHADGTPETPLDLGSLGKSNAARVRALDTRLNPSSAEGERTVIPEGDTDTNIPTSGVAEPKKLEHMTQTLLISGRSHWPLSEAIKAGLGVGGMQVIVEGAAEEFESPFASLSQQAIIESVDDHFKLSGKTGLAFCLSAASRLREYARGTSSLRLISNAMAFSPPWPHDTKAPPSYHLNINATSSTRAEPSAAYMNISLPAMTATLQGVSEPQDVGIVQFAVEFRDFRLSHTSGPSSGIGPSAMGKEVSAIAGTAHLVAQRLSEGMTFLRRETFAQLLSEALLRTLRGQSFAGEVIGVEVTLNTSTAQVPKVHAHSSWEGFVPPRTEDQRGGHTGEATSDTTHAPHISHQTSPAVDAHSTALESGEISRGCGYHNKGRQFAAWSEPNLMSDEFARLTGLQTYGYRIRGIPKDNSNSSLRSSEGVESMIEGIIRTSAGSGLRYLHDITARMTRQLPSAEVTLTGRSPGTSIQVAKLQAGGNLNIRAYASRSNVISIAIILPQMHGLPLAVENFASGSGFLGVTLHGTVPMETGYEDHATVVSFAAMALRQISDAARPWFARTKAANVDDKLAASVASSLTKAPLFALDTFRLSKVVVRVGVGEFGKSPRLGIATAFVRKTESVFGDPSSTETAETKQEFAEMEEEDLPDAHDSVAPFDGHQEILEEEGQLAFSGYEPKITATGVTAYADAKILSHALRSKAGLTHFGFRVHWTDTDIAALPGLTLDGIARAVLHRCQTEQAFGFELLHNVARSASAALPLQPALTMKYRQDFAAQQITKEQPRIFGQLYVELNGQERSLANPMGLETMSQPCARIRIVFPKLSGLLWGRGTDARLCYVIVTMEATLVVRRIDVHNPSVSDIATQVLLRIKNLLGPLLLDSDPKSPPESLARASAVAILDSSTVLPPGLISERVDVQLCEICRRGQVPLAIGTQQRTQPACADTDDPAMEGKVYVAIGSNVGDRIGMIETACRMIDADSGMDVLRTSSLYETKPMYVESQDEFLNGVCEIRTPLQPLELLDRLQAIEQQLGRVKTIDKGPRNIDLDILLYKGIRLGTERLTIPHALMHEREFVLRPLLDLKTRRIPPLSKTGLMLLKEVAPLHSDMVPYTPIGPNAAAITTRNRKRSTRIMSILNTTPDSFSDGGMNEPTDIEALRSTAARHIAEGATIIDIGGQSSRPNAPDITAEEELARILPAVEAIKSLPEAEHIAISIDTYRAAVAEAAIKAGAHIINDISAGLLDPDMLSTVARLGCTYIMMHMRGTPSTMQDPEHTSYPAGLIPTIASELRSRLHAAQEAGIRRWRIILDPGIGFAKTQEQNLEILRKMPELIRASGIRNLPWLVGSSRKGFVGKITGVSEAKERTWGTAATVTAAVAGGADVVRVHDVGEMAQVVRMAEAMYRV